MRGRPCLPPTPPPPTPSNPCLTPPCPPALPRAVLRNWRAAYPSEAAFFIPAGLEQRVAAGKLGRKSGEGYYKWEGDKALAPV